MSAEKIVITLNAKLKEDFKKKCKSESKTMKYSLVKFIEEYVSK